LLETGGVSILMTTHQLDEAERLCTRIGIMKDGRICAEGTVAELLSRVPAELVAFVQGPDESALLARAAQLGWAVRRYAGRIACLLQRRLDLRQIAEAFAGVEISAVSCERVALEHAYLEVLQGATSADA
jgi:ABC-2 type transport system ATP-binding protein